MRHGVVAQENKLKCVMSESLASTLISQTPSGKKHVQDQARCPWAMLSEHLITLTGKKNPQLVRHRMHIKEHKAKMTL